MLYRLERRLKGVVTKVAEDEEKKIVRLFWERMGEEAPYQMEVGQWYYKSINLQYKVSEVK